jgi:hypothetical protein
MMSGGFDRVDYVADGIAAAVALEAAAQIGSDVHSIVCLGGRPDLAPRLGAICSPVLFVVCEDDPVVVRLTHQAQERLSCPQRMMTISGAGHRFREPGALREASVDLLKWLQGSHGIRHDEDRAGCAAERAGAGGCEARSGQAEMLSSTQDQ